MPGEVYIYDIPASCLRTVCVVSYVFPSGSGRCCRCCRGRPKQAGGVCTSGIVPSVHGPPHDFAFQAGVVVGSMRNSGFCLFACLVRIRA